MHKELELNIFFLELPLIACIQQLHLMKNVF